MSKSNPESLKLAKNGILAIYQIILYTFYMFEIFLQMLFRQCGWSMVSDV